jgi:hypothetical protein
MQIKIHNIKTGEIIERDMNAEELAQHASDKAAAEAAEVAKAASDAARQAVLEKLGLTADEAAALLG